MAEIHEPGVSVPMVEVAQRCNLNANRIFRWWQLFREPERAVSAGRLVLVVVEAAPGREAGTAAMPPPSGNAVAEGLSATGRVIVDHTVDEPALSRVIAVLERR